MLWNIDCICVLMLYLRMHNLRFVLLHLLIVSEVANFFDRSENIG